MRLLKIPVFAGSFVFFAAAAQPASGQCSPVEFAKRTATDGAAGDNFGISVAFDGDTAIVGAWGADTTGGTDAGAAYVLIRNGGLWSQQAKLIASDGATNDNFGLSVAVSGDTAVVGASGLGGGAAYVYVRSGVTWTQQAKLTASDAAAGDEFGVSVAIEGNTIVVGAASDDNTGGADAGSAYVFTRSGTFWAQQAKLTASDGAAGDSFGYSVALSGSSAIVGAGSDDTTAGSNAGSAYVFIRCGTVWTEQAKLVASDGAANDAFGVSVAISGDMAIVGASGDDTPAGSDAGSAYVFTRSGGAWVQQAKLTASDAGAGDQFGISVAIDRDTVIIGAYTDDVPSGSNAGSVYVFTANIDTCSSPWTQQAKLTASDGAAGDEFGYAVAIAHDTAVVGVFSDDTAAGGEAGSMYVYTLGCDSDGDGIVNSKDACPNNSPSLQVDGSGRPLLDCNHDCLVNAADIQCIVNVMLSQ
ncbi:MAG TPA: FG-GAP repeat protein [Phycisphaerae bacterium]|nr:FG-GAP repeat protein [Phycisphaerae bacterium]